MISSRNRRSKNWIRLLRKIGSSRVVEVLWSHEILMNNLWSCESACIHRNYIFALWDRHNWGLQGKVLRGTFGGRALHSSRPSKGWIIERNCSAVNWRWIVIRKLISKFVKLKLSWWKEKLSFLIKIRLICMTIAL